MDPELRRQGQFQRYKVTLTMFRLHTMCLSLATSLRCARLSRSKDRRPDRSVYARGCRRQSHSLLVINYSKSNPAHRNNYSWRLLRLSCSYLTEHGYPTHGPAVLGVIWCGSRCGGRPSGSKLWISMSIKISTTATITRLQEVGRGSQL